MYYKYELKDFLKSLKDSDIKPLVEIIRTKAEFTNALKDQKYLDLPSKYACDIVEELSRFGSNTFASFFRGEGIEYGKIVQNVANKVKASYSANDTTDNIENAIILKLFNDCFKKLDYKEQEEIKNLLDYEVNGEEFFDSKGLKAGMIYGGAHIAALSTIVLYNSIAIIANSIYLSIVGKGLTDFSVKVVNSSGIGFLKGSLKGLKLGGKPILKGGLKVAAKGSLKGGLESGVTAGTKIIAKKASVGALSKTFAALGGPIGWAIIGTWVAFDIASPAYRVILPSIIYIIYLKRKHALTTYSDLYD